MEKSRPARAQAIIRECATLLPSRSGGRAGRRLLADGHQVGERLAWVQFVGQPVDHGHCGVLGHLHDGAVLEGAQHQQVHVSRQDAGGVGDRLPASDLQVAVGEEDRLASELRHPRFEADPGSSGRLLEVEPIDLPLSVSRCDWGLDSSCKASSRIDSS